MENRLKEIAESVLLCNQNKPVGVSIFQRRQELAKSFFYLRHKRAPRNKEEWTQALAEFEDVSQGFLEEIKTLPAEVLGESTCLWRWTLGFLSQEEKSRLQSFLEN